MRKGSVTVTYWPSTREAGILSEALPRYSLQRPVYGHILEEGHRLDRETTPQRFEDALRGATEVQLRPGAPNAETAETQVLIFVVSEVTLFL